MARHEADREDLFSELASAELRWELQVPGRPTSVVTGVRPGGVWSIYFHADCVYHFDATGGLRRAYLAGDLYRSEGDTLARLRRERTPEETILHRDDLTAAELAAMIADMQQQVREFASALQTGRVTILRQLPDTDDASLALLLGRCQQVFGRTHPLSPALK